MKVFWAMSRCNHQLFLAAVCSRRCKRSPHNDGPSAVPHKVGPVRCPSPRSPNRLQKLGGSLVAVESCKVECRPTKLRSITAIYTHPVTPSHGSIIRLDACVLLQSPPPFQTHTLQERLPAFISLSLCL